MGDFLHTIFYVPIESSLMFFYHLSGDNIGIAIIILTLIIRIILVPLTIPSLRSAQKMKDLKKPLDEIKARYKSDPKRLQEEQLKLYKEHGINPASGCLPVLLQLPILIFLYRVFLDVLGKEGINPNFLIFNLSQPDKYFILPILSGVTQFVLSFMMSDPTPKKSKEDKKEKGKAEDFSESLTGALQTQNLYIMPLLWFFMLLKLPSGIGIYWVVSTILSLVQQFIFIGPGRLKTIFKKTAIKN